MFRFFSSDRFIEKVTEKVTQKFLDQYGKRLAESMPKHLKPDAIRAAELQSKTAYETTASQLTSAGEIAAIRAKATRSAAWIRASSTLFGTVTLGYFGYKYFKPIEADSKDAKEKYRRAQENKLQLLSTNSRHRTEIKYKEANPTEQQFQEILRERATLDAEHHARYKDNVARGIHPPVTVTPMTEAELKQQVDAIVRERQQQDRELIEHLHHSQETQQSTVSAKP